MSTSPRDQFNVLAEGLVRLLADGSWQLTNDAGAHIEVGGAFAELAALLDQAEPGEQPIRTNRRADELDEAIARAHHLDDPAVFAPEPWPVADQNQHEPTATSPSNAAAVPAWLS